MLKKTVLLLMACMLLWSARAAAERTITLSFTGDVTLGSEEWRKDQPGTFHEYAKEKGYGWFFAKVKDLFEKDDLTIVNLEGVLSDSNANENKSKAYRFRGPADYAKILKEGSIEVCSVSNNHTYDFGPQGYKNTLAALDTEGIAYFGNDICWVYEKDGIRIAFFSVVSTGFENQKKWFREKSKQLKEEGVNAFIYCFHAGNEYRSINWMQRHFADLAVHTMGADLVVMHHPHIVQGLEVLDNRYVFYSLGNFCFGGNAEVRALESMILQADLRFSDDGEYLGCACRIYPAYISSSAQKAGDANNFQPRLASADEAEAVFALIQKETPFDLGIFDEEDGYLALPFLGVTENEAKEP